jgi:proteasome lid subunit RPN8/RPN11
VIISEEVINGIYKHAIEEYPNECCGIVTGGSEGETLHKCKNIQNELHAEDPERHPRDSRTAYAIDRKEADRIYTEAAGKGEKVIAFYHSHIDCDAYFSDTDIAAQTVFGEPEFPEAIHIVVSVMAGNIAGIKCFRWDTEKEKFITY